jgi:hypothetical protein
MKTLLLTLASLLTFSSYVMASETVVMITFGIDGASGKSSPLNTSDRDADAIFKAMGGTDNVRKVEFENKAAKAGLESHFDNFYMAMEKPGKLVELTAPHEITMTGQPAEFLMASLVKVKEVKTQAGGVTKSVANLKCTSTQGSTRLPVTKCVFTNANLTRI